MKQRSLIALMLASCLVIAIAGPVAAAGGGDRLADGLGRIKAIKERLLQLANSSSYGQHGMVKYLHYDTLQLPLALSQVRAYRQSLEAALAMPVSLFIERRGAIDEIVAYRRWGRATALASVNPFNRDAFELIMPIVPGWVVPFGTPPGRKTGKMERAGAKKKK